MKKILFVFFLLLGSAISIVFYQFPSLPSSLASDEVAFARLALSLEHASYTPYSPLATGHTTLYFYLILLSFKLFGITSFALRFPSALFAIGSTALMYVLIHQIIEPKKNKESYLVPFLITMAFFTSHWFLTFARYSFEATFLLFLELTTVISLFSLWKKPRIITAVLVGVFTGLTFNSYTPGRLFAIFIIFVILFLFIKTSKLYFRKIYILAGILSIICMLPLSFYFFSYPDIRVQQLMFATDPNMTVVQKISSGFENIIKIAGMFFFRGDMNGRHNYPGKPALNPLLFMFFISGFFLAIRNISNKKNLFMIGLFIISLLPSLLTYPWENPSMLRTIGTLIPIFVFCSFTLQFMLKNIKIPVSILKIIISICILISCIYELRTYFIYQQVVFMDAFEEKQKLENIIPSQ